MAKYYLAIRGSKVAAGIDLNSDAPTALECGMFHVRTVRSDMVPVCTPLDLGQPNVLCSIDARQALEFISAIDGSVGISRYV